MVDADRIMNVMLKLLRFLGCQPAAHTARSAPKRSSAKTDALVEALMVTAQEAELVALLALSAEYMCGES